MDAFDEIRLHDKGCIFRRNPPSSSSSSFCSVKTFTLFFLLFFLERQQQKQIFVHGRSIDRNRPHSHHGLLTPYSPGPFQNFQLQPNDEQDLAEGKPVMKQVADTTTSNSPPSIESGHGVDNGGGGGGGPGGRAICIQDVHAPKEAVWRQILDLDCYRNKVSSVKECNNYSFHVDSKKGNVYFKTKMVIGVMPGYSYEYYCDHTFHPSHDSVTWSLDYEKISDFDDVAGHWHLQDHPTKRGYTRVFYACDIKFKNPIPGPIMNFLTKAALKNATGWVKRESEQHPTDKFPSAFIVGTGVSSSQTQSKNIVEGEMKHQEGKRNFFLKPQFRFRKG